MSMSQLCAVVFCINMAIRLMMASAIVAALFGNWPLMLYCLLAVVAIGVLYGLFVWAVNK